MAKKIKLKDDRLYLRIGSKDFALIKKAADKSGQTVSDYVRDPAIKKAKEELEEGQDD